MQLSLIHTIWSVDGSPATGNMRFGGSPSTASLCAGKTDSNYQAKQTGDRNRLEQEI
jgi:hypothetical protein